MAHELGDEWTVRAIGGTSVVLRRLDCLLICLDLEASGDGTFYRPAWFLHCLAVPSDGGLTYSLGQRFRSGPSGTGDLHVKPTVSARDIATIMREQRAVLFREQYTWVEIVALYTEERRLSRDGWYRFSLDCELSVVARRAGFATESARALRRARWYRLCHARYRPASAKLASALRALAIATSDTIPDREVDRLGLGNIPMVRLVDAKLWAASRSPWIA